MFKLALEIMFLLQRKNAPKSKLRILHANDSLSYEVMQRGCYEQRYFRALDKYFTFSDKAIALDVGANIGNHSVQFAEIFSHVYSFEPVQQNLRLLEVNCENKNISVFNYGLSDKSNKFYIHYSDSNMGESVIADGNLKHVDLNNLDQKSEITTKALDQVPIFNNVANIEFIKIDIEGHELSALRGMKQTLQRTMPVISLEIHKSEVVNGSTATIDFLRALGYDTVLSPTKFAFNGNKALKLLKYIMEYFWRDKLSKVSRLKKTDYPFVFVTKS